MNEKEWNVKRTCYICACITSDFVGTAILWNTSEEAWKDAEERVEAFIEGEENLKYLNNRYLKQSVETTAKRLNRSIPSVKGKARKLGLNNYYGEKISAKTLAKCFHSDIRVILRWIDKFDLPCKKVELDNQTRYSIDPVEFWKWAENHKDIINWKKYERETLFPEPSWINYEWKKDNGKPERHRNRITDFEKAAIKGMMRKGMGNKEIAKEINRTYYATVHITSEIYY